MGRLGRALRSRGVLYTSFKYGEGEVCRGGLLFQNHSERTIGELVERQPALGLVKCWLSEDVRAKCAGEVWLNVLLRKA